MKFDRGKNVKYVEFNLDLTPKEQSALVEYARENINNDLDYLINWSVNNILQKMVEEIGYQPDMIENMIKEKIKNKQKRGKNARQ